MNELMINYENGNYIYFKTNMTTAWDAYHEFERKCGQVGINCDNMSPTETVLMNEEFEHISVWKFW